MQLKIDVAGEAQVSRAFAVYGKEADDLREPLSDIADELREAIGEQFRTEGTRGGSKWKALSPSYRRWKEANYPGRPMLVRTGDMRSAMLDRLAFHVNRKRMLYAPNVPLTDDGEQYALIHQQGRGQMPRRKMVNLTTADKRQFERIFAHWLTYIRRRSFR